MSDRIIGRWEVISSEINNRENPLMKGGFFEFKADKTIDSDVFGEVNPSTYSVNGNKNIDITKTDGEVVKFTISDFSSDDTIKINGNLQYYDLKFILKRL
ncbi:MAG: hypothetical protein H6567_09155 [Lewinellaceae bacterium]|nr:hypothetical protein [Lewinellaceae bacterium]